MPPTPTAIPYIPAPITLPQMNLWTNADNVVGVWNMLGADRTTIAQWVVILFIVIGAIFFLMPLIKSLAGRETTTE